MMPFLMFRLPFTLSYHIKKSRLSLPRLLFRSLLLLLSHPLFSVSEIRFHVTIIENENHVFCGISALPEWCWFICWFNCWFTCWFKCWFSCWFKCWFKCCLNHDIWAKYDLNSCVGSLLVQNLTENLFKALIIEGFMADKCSRQYPFKALSLFSFPSAVFPLFSALIFPLAITLIFLCCFTSFIFLAFFLQYQHNISVASSQTYPHSFVPCL